MTAADPAFVIDPRQERLSRWRPVSASGLVDAAAAGAPLHERIDVRAEVRER